MVNHTEDTMTRSEKAIALGNEPAFPVETSVGYYGKQTGLLTGWSIGLTKREYFAGLAMQGIISNATGCSTFMAYSQDAIGYADVLLEELVKEDKP